MIWGLLCSYCCSTFASCAYAQRDSVLCICIIYAYNIVFIYARERVYCVYKMLLFYVRSSVVIARRKRKAR